MAKNNFEKAYAEKLIRRVVAKLRRSARNRSRADFARAYRVAADRIAERLPAL